MTFSFSVTKEDVEVLRWLAAQTNVSQSVRKAIEALIAQEGITDVSAGSSVKGRRLATITAALASMEGGSDEKTPEAKAETPPVTPETSSELTDKTPASSPNQGTSGNVSMGDLNSFMGFGQ